MSRLRMIAIDDCLAGCGGDHFALQLDGAGGRILLEDAQLSRRQAEAVFRVLDPVAEAIPTPPRKDLR